MGPRVTVWSEHHHERHDAAVAAVYREGIHGAVAEGLRAEGIATGRTATQEQAEHGLSAAVLAQTDVLFWWAHVRHEAVSDEVVAAIVGRVHAGMGLVVLHSGFGSKVFHALMGTSARLDGWRHGDAERLWTITPRHPIARGVPHPLVLPVSEMYCEPFDVPRPDDTVFVSSYSGGEVFRSGLTFRRGRGRIFFFAPGHEEYPIYRDLGVRHILANAARWAAPDGAGPLPRSEQRERGWFEREAGA